MGCAAYKTKMLRQSQHERLHLWSPKWSSRSVVTETEETLKQCWLEEKESVLQGARGKAITRDFSDHCSSKAKQRQVQIERHWDFLPSDRNYR